MEAIQKFLEEDSEGFRLILLGSLRSENKEIEQLLEKTSKALSDTFWYSSMCGRVKIACGQSW